MTRGFITIATGKEMYFRLSKISYFPINFALYCCSQNSVDVEKVNLLEF